MANGKYLPPNHPGRIQRDTAMAGMHIQGMSTAEIAAEIGLDKSQVSRVLNTDHIKEIIQDNLTKMVASLPGIRKRFIKLCYSKNENVATKNIHKFLDVMGVSPSHTPNTLIQNIFADKAQINTTQHELITEALNYRHKIKPTLPQDVVVSGDNDDE